MDKQPDILDNVLKKRYLPDMRTNLEHRIIMAAASDVAHGKDQKQPGLLSGLLSGILLPRPVLSLLLLLFVGFGIGLGSGTYTGVQSVDDAVDVVDYFVFSDDEIGYGDFL